MATKKRARCVLPPVAGHRWVRFRARVAKKVRTPPPPRRVQAPQKRETRRAAGISTRPPWFYAAIVAGAVVLIAAIALGVILTRDNGDSSSKSKANVAAYNRLPGIRKTKAPWPPEYQFLADRLPPLGLTTLPQEAVNTHYHSHLDIFVDGKKVSVPALIGINTGAQYLTELHTHDTRGVIHIESPKSNDEFTLGQFLAEWGVFLNSRCIGAYCDNLKWYLNGKQQTGNPQDHTLESHDEIAIVVGKPPKKIPSSYQFLAGEGVPGAGLEPARPATGTADFKSAAYRQFRHPGVGQDSLRPWRS